MCGKEVGFQPTGGGDRVRTSMTSAGVGQAWVRHTGEGSLRRLTTDEGLCNLYGI